MPCACAAAPFERQRQRNALSSAPKIKAALRPETQTSKSPHPPIPTTPICAQRCVESTETPRSRRSALQATCHRFHRAPSYRGVRMPLVGPHSRFHIANGVTAGSDEMARRVALSAVTSHRWPNAGEPGRCVRTRPLHHPRASSRSKQAPRRAPSWQSEVRSTSLEVGRSRRRRPASGRRWAGAVPEVGSEKAFRFSRTSRTCGTVRTWSLGTRACQR
jgi:hypothetical protein